MIEILRKVNDLSAPAQIRDHIRPAKLFKSFAEIFAEEFFNRGKGDDVFLIIQIRVACSGYDHKQFVVLLTWDYGEFPVSILRLFF